MGTAIETDDNGFKIGDLPLNQAIESIRDKEALKRFFTSGGNAPNPAPKRVFSQGWDY